MTQRQLALPVLFGALFLVLGCDDDTSSPELGPGTLSTSDAEAIANQTAAAVIGAMEAGFTTNVGLAATTAVPVDFTRNDTRDCQAGGTMTTSVTVEGDMTQGPSDLTISGSTIFDQCARGGQERTLTMDGELSHSGTVTVTDMGREASFTMSGQLSWNVEPGDNGGCAVELSVTFGDGAHGVSGTVCGHEVDGAS